MMKPVQDGQRDDAPGEFRAPVHRLLLVDARVRDAVNGVFVMQAAKIAFPEASDLTPAGAVL
jgi:hypothetical protein